MKTRSQLKTIVILMISIILLTNCTKQDDSPVRLKEITLNQTDVILTVGDTETIEITTDIGERSIAWGSENDSIATIANGTITAIKSGQTKVYATVDDAYAECVVTVNPLEITLNQTEIDIFINETGTLQITSDIRNNTPTWSSSDESIATVSQDGVVSGLQTGDVTITVEVAGTTAQCLVHIKAINVTLNQTEIDVFIGETGTLQITSDIRNNTPTWSSSDESIATVSQDGVVSGLQIGDVTITVEVAGTTAQCLVHIKAINVTLNKTQTVIYVGETETLQITSDTRNNTPTWSSSDESIATVNQNGMITGVQVGTTIITVTVAGSTAQCQVTVQQAVTTPVLTLTGDDYLGIEACSSGSITFFNVNWNGQAGQFTLQDSMNDAAISINQQTGEISYTSAVQFGEHTLTVTATNSAGSTLQNVVINKTLSGTFSGYQGTETEVNSNQGISVQFTFSGNTVTRQVTTASVVITSTGTFTISADGELVIEFVNYDTERITATLACSSSANGTFTIITGNTVFYYGQGGTYTPPNGYIYITQ